MTYLIPLLFLHGSDIHNSRILVTQKTGGKRGRNNILLISNEREFKTNYMSEAHRGGNVLLNSQAFSFD